MANKPSPQPVVDTRNCLLAALMPRDFEHLQSGLERVPLELGAVLHEPGAQIEHVYFPESGLVSMLAVAYGHHAVEVGLTGREGMIGVPLALGHDSALMGAFVQSGGTALRLSAARFRRELLNCTTLRQHVYGFAANLLAQVAQTAACNRFHVLEQRLARWLLMAQDRLEAEQFRMTHEFLGHMLGVRRVGVTKAAYGLQRAGLIHYRRGNIFIEDRAGLERVSCPCYAVVRALSQTGLDTCHLLDMDVAAPAQADFCAKAHIQ